MIEWTAEFCETVVVENDNGSKHSKCECKTLNPTSVISDVDNIFKNSDVKKVFSTEGVT